MEGVRVPVWVAGKKEWYGKRRHYHSPEAKGVVPEGRHTSLQGEEGDAIGFGFG
jgi:hypothetical protein